MMLEIDMELHIFLSAVWTGTVVFNVFMVLGLAEATFRFNKFLICLVDGCYWLWTSWYVFVQIFRATNGVIRWYFILGIVVGIWSTHMIWYSAKKVVKLIEKKLANKYKKKYY